jgi:ABC-2 type transport system permease protein
MATSTAPHLAAPRDHGLLFQWLRWRLLRNSLRVVLSQSSVRLLTILACSALIWVGLFALSCAGFHELKTRWNIDLEGRIFSGLFDVLFVVLTVLLLFSTALILYSSLFAAPETAFLLAGPVAADHVFAYKFQGAVAFSSWAFVLLGTPILLAYGLLVGDGAPWYFYALLPLFFLGFVLLPGSLGALLCLLLVNFLPRRRKQVFWLLGLALTAVVGWWVYSRVLSPAHDGLLSRDWLGRILGDLSMLQGSLMPSHWVSEGLTAAARGEVVDALYYLTLVCGNGLFLYVLTAWAAARLYRRGFNSVATGGSLRRRYGGAWLDNALSRLLGFLDPQTRLLIVKDFRTFRRDPAQWAQILIFVGLAVLYSVNMRRFYERDIGAPFRNGISLLNLCAVAFLMCAYTGRFIYPMLSLEGRKFWILGLLPLQRERLLWGKFAFSATGCLLIAEGLSIFSNLMLGLPWYIIAVHALTVAVLALGFSGLSVGLGACMPNFRETDPSKIAVGFGGTLNLVAGLALLLVVVGAMALPWHLAIAAVGEREFTLTLGHWWLGLGDLFGLAVGAVAVFVPLHSGAFALRRMEF